MGPLGPAVALILFCIFYIQVKGRKTTKVLLPEVRDHKFVLCVSYLIGLLNFQVKQARIEAYESLPLIDGIDLLDIDRKKLDVHQPDEVGMFFYC